MTGLSQSKVGLFVTMGIFFFVTVNCSKRERINNCTQEDQCRINASACLSHEESECYSLGTTKIYDEPGQRSLSAYTTDPRAYRSKKFSVFEIYHKTEPYITTVIDHCCDINFGQTCMIPPKRDNYYISVYSVTKEGRICIHEIEYHERFGETVWCCNKTLNLTCEKKFPCLKFKNGQIIKEEKSEPVSFDRHDTAEYCFFTASNKQLKQGKQITENLIYDVDGFALDSVNMTVSLNGTKQNCENKTIVNLSRDKAALRCLSREKAWCFFVRGEGFEKFSSSATCFVSSDECSNIETVEVALTVVLATVAILTTLLVIAIALICLYKSKIKAMFQKKEDTIKDIPKCTKEMIMGMESETQIASKQTPVSYFIYKEGNPRTFERYTNMKQVKTLDFDVVDKMNEKPEKITNFVKKIEADDNSEDVSNELRERHDSGFAADPSGDNVHDLTGDIISNEPGYCSKALHDPEFPSTTQISSGMASPRTDSGISSMASDSGGNFCLAHNDYAVKQFRSPHALRDLAKKAASHPGKHITSLSVLNEVSFNLEDTVELDERESPNNEIFLPQPDADTRDGYTDKNCLKEVHKTELEKCSVPHISSKNMNCLQDPDSLNLQLQNFTKDYRRGPEGDEAWLRIARSGENHQRCSVSSMDTGCGTNSYDGDDYCRQNSLNEEIMLPGEDNCQGYVMKSDPLLYGNEDMIHSTQSEFSHPVNELAGYTAKLDV